MITRVSTRLDFRFPGSSYRLRPGLTLSQQEILDAPLLAIRSRITLDFVDDRP